MIASFRKIMLAALLLLTSSAAWAERQTDISLLPVMQNSKGEVDETVSSALLNKVKDELTAQGLAAGEGSRFILVVNPELSDKQQNGQQLMFSYTLQFSVVDLITDKTYSSFRQQMGGVGKTEAQAMMDAIRRLDLSKSKLQSYLDNSVASILRYYQANCKSIIEKAKLYMAAGKYDAALGQLAFIPDVPKLSCHATYNQVLLSALKQYTAYKCHAQLVEAKRAWSLDPTLEGAAAVSAVLSGITLSPDCKKEYEVLLSSIKSKLERDQFDEKEFTKTVFKSYVDIERDSIAAAKDIAVAYYQNMYYKDYYRL
ncbi:hypothetical protein [Pedobacter sp. GR22-6]|uniref:hypothetical protein n=1 Tax=Pedobacter sp. GR22-6 TaxID=3127957 RepID=UPI00307DC584